MLGVEAEIIHDHRTIIVEKLSIPGRPDREIVTEEAWKSDRKASTSRDTSALISTPFVGTVYLVVETTPLRKLSGPRRTDIFEPDCELEHCPNPIFSR
jgi:hypothetical protein